MHTRALRSRALAGITPVVGCTLLTAVGANLAVRLPYTPVPITLLTAAMFASALLLGSRRAFAAQTLYLAIGLAGAPVFAFGGGGPLYLLNPMGTGGFLVALPLAAWVTGRVAERTDQGGLLGAVLACMAGIGVVYGVGCAWLALWLHLSPIEAVLRGAGAFLMWDVAKALLVAAALRRTRHSELLG